MRTKYVFFSIIVRFNRWIIRDKINKQNEMWQKIKTTNEEKDDAISPLSSVYKRGLFSSYYK